MLITTARVNNGVIKVDRNDLPDGTTVTLIAAEGDETFELDATQTAKLQVVIAEIDRGEFVSVPELLRQIHRA